MDYYFSFSSTFNSFYHGLISRDDLSRGTLLFGWDRSVLLRDGTAPVRLTAYNTTKPKPEGVSLVGDRDLDPEVLKKWSEFRQIVTARDEEGAVIWNRTGENYPRKCFEFLKAGHRVYWNGRWQNIQHYKWVGDEAA